MAYTADSYDFGPITLSGGQHRRIAEIHEDLLALGGDAAELGIELLTTMFEASVSDGNEESDLLRDLDA